MAERIDLPPMLQGSPEEQLQQLRSYLYQMATTLNVNQELAGSEAVTLTDEERILMNNINRMNGAEDAYTPAFNHAEAETLKSLIIKTAKFVKTVQDTYNLILYGEESAQSDYGTWNRKKGLRVDVTPDGIKQTYSYAEIIKGLKDYEINAKSYIKTGQLRTEQGLPVYGVAIGKDVTTFSENGTETFQDGNKCAELTADKLTFYVGQDPSQRKIAQFAGDELAFYQGNEQKVMSLLANALTFLSGGKKLTELKPAELAFYQGNEQKVASLKDDSLTFLSGGKKLSELKPAELSFYQGNEQMVASLKDDSLTFLSGGKKLSELKPAELSFYQGNEQKVASLKDDSLTFLSNGKKLTELKPAELAFYQGNEQKVAILKDDSLTFLSGGKKLSELKQAELAFYQGNEQKVASLKDDGLTFLSNGKKLTELKPAELAFYQGNEQKVASLKDDGLTFLSGGKKIAEMKPAGIVMYQGTDQLGNEIKVMDLKGSGLEFYYNGVLRSKMDQNGTSFYKGNDTTNDLLARMNGTALQFYENGTLMVEISAGDQQQSIAPTIFFHENVEIPSEVNNEKGIKLQSGSSIVLIDPSQINMNTPGLIVLKGSGNSVIDFRDETNGIVMKLDKEGLVTQSMQADAAEFETLIVKNLIAEDLQIPKVVYSNTRPTNVHEVIWLEPNTTGSQETIDETTSVTSAAAHSCPQRTRSTFTYKGALASRLDLTGIDTITVSGTFVRQGQDQQNGFTVSAVINCSDGSTISIGQIASGSLFGSYSFSETLSYGGGAKTATGITYTLTVADDFAHYSSFAAGTMRIQGQRDGQGSGDDCTVHYIP